MAKKILNAKLALVQIRFVEASVMAKLDINALTVLNGFL